jgi:NAD(P)-dependent dehydrogenase (short-subunit alcohol dehydrogenase family)
MAPYVASKHALVGMMKTMAKELGPAGIRVNMVLPGNTNTALFRSGNTRQALSSGGAISDEAFLSRAARRVPMRIPYVEADDVAEAVLWLVSDAARYITGIAVPVDGGATIV